MATYYVATTGNDSGTGAIGDPWLTLAYASWQVRAGDTLYIRGGTYTGTGIVATFPYDGTAENRITVDNYQNEEVILDAQDTYPTTSVYDPVVYVPGTYTTIRDITIHDSKGTGLIMTGTGCHALNITGIDSREAGIVLSGNNQVADGCSWTNCGRGYDGNNQTTWGSAIGTTGTNCTISNCTAYNNVGEGINAGGTANNCTVQDCVAYDNDSVNLYLDSGVGTIVRRNLIYDTTQTPASGITIGAEVRQPSDLVIENNIVKGCFVNLNVDGNVNQMLRNKIVHNTFVNGKGDGEGYNMGVYFRNIATYSGSVFMNNIVVEELAGRTPITVLDSSHAGLEFDFNCWNKASDADAQGANDVTGDPLLANTSGTTAASFKIGAGSPCIDAGVNVEVGDDYFGQHRPIGAGPDIGAHEYDATGKGALRHRTIKA